MASYRIEIQNASISNDNSLVKFCACRNNLCIPIFLITGVEIPFRGVGLDHMGDKRN